MSPGRPLNNAQEQANDLREKVLKEARDAEKEQREAEREQKAVDRVNRQRQAVDTVLGGTEGIGGTAAAMGAPEVGLPVAEGFDKHVHPWFFFIVALLLHAFDVINGFSRSAGQATVMFLLYALFTFWAIFFYYRTGLTKDSGRYVGVSLVAFALPYIFLIPAFNGGYVPLIVTLLPVWALYIALEQDSALWLKRIAKLYIVILIFLLFIMLIARVQLPGVSSPAVLIGQSAKRFWTGVTDAWANIWLKLKSANIFNVAMWKQKINETFNPEAQFYLGQVEQNQKQPQGVYITQLQSLYPVTYVGQQPAVIGRIEAKTFLPGGGVNVTPSCRLERAGKTGYVGTPDRTGTILVNEYLPVDVTCTFPADPNMTIGTYYGVLGAAFNFETWAYVTDTFVARSAIVNEQQQGRDIHTDLGIDPTTTAIYTNGPVSIGILADQQPIAIDPDAPTGSFISQRFGFTVANVWDQGMIEGGSVEAEVLVPQPFQLKEGSCLPTGWTGQPTTDANGMTHYLFTRDNSLQIDARNDYRTVTCQLILPDKQSAEQVLSFGEKTPVTFVVIARYKYDIEQKVPVRVEK